MPWQATAAHMMMARRVRLSAPSNDPIRLSRFSRPHVRSPKAALLLSHNSVTTSSHSVPTRLSEPRTSSRTFYNPRATIRAAPAAATGPGEANKSFSSDQLVVRGFRYGELQVCRCLLCFGHACWCLVCWWLCVGVLAAHLVSLSVHLRLGGACVP